MTARLRIGGVPEHFNLPWTLAIAAGAFDRIGVNVDFVEFPDGTGAMTAALAADELDAALVLTEGAVLDIVNGGNNRLVSVYVDSPLVWGIHVAANSAIQDVSAIAGKRYAISRFGSGSHLIAIVDAAERGFHVNDDQFVIVGTIDGAREALAEHRADVFLWEKHMTQPLVDSGEFRRIGERAVPWPAFVVSARRHYLADHSDALREVLAVVCRYAAELKSGDSSADLISETYEIERVDALSWLDHVRWSCDTQEPNAALARIVAALRSQGVVANDASQTIDIWQSL